VRPRRRSSTRATRSCTRWSTRRTPVGARWTTTKFRRCSMRPTPARPGCGGRHGRVP
jgi:hypothetical protein